MQAMSQALKFLTVLNIVAVAEAKLILVMSHTSCGAVKASVDFVCNHETASEATGCVNLNSFIQENFLSDCAKCAFTK
ncbi:putative uncharacterized protein [Parachlamydia acanthamoebae UV-7]|jgi:carbonic anhydrase|uniref:Carbonic anhydrase n=4 Tax=Parachlamydia acanthamoebae TaxID=83552 RepID=F8KZY7_PARAV|nr:hypothetical protein [Parachlamydia acanthamoebae]KIA77794.1 hypothetical protein DB43_FS00350 [Parachlamydia acanthamoebae]CCB86496.1 putative uncharacterized protein [Parachlamydia acanthamoebae UV-7]